LDSVGLVYVLFGHSWVQTRGRLGVVEGQFVASIGVVGTEISCATCSGPIQLPECRRLIAILCSMQVLAKYKLINGSSKMGQRALLRF